MKRCDQCGKEISITNCQSVNGITLCGKHYAQLRKYGHFLDNNPKTTHDANDYEETSDGIWIITRNRKQEESGRFLIDKDDFDRVIVHKWRYWKNYYFTGNQFPISIHHFIMNYQNNEGNIVDHINGDTSDNRKANLRLIPQQYNTINKKKQRNNVSGITGVWFDNSRNKWCAEIKLNKKIYLGRYENIADAAFARYIAENILFDEYRSKRNDKTIIPLIKQSSQKQKICSYVKNRLRQFCMKTLIPQ